jgi:hypothetical protein
MVKLTAKINCNVRPSSARERKDPSAMTHSKIGSSISEDDTHKSAGATACAPEIQSLMRRVQNAVERVASNKRDSF